MIGGGMSHRGFMGRKKGGLVCGSPPPGFRFLHDEISGGLLAASKIQCKASYNCEDIVNVGVTSATGISYPLTNGVLDLSAIQADYPSVTGARFRDQTDFPYGNLSGNSSGWTGSNLIKGGSCVSKSFTAISNTVPLTVVIVANGLDADLGDNYFIMNGESNIRLQYFSNDLFFQLNGGGTFTRQTYSGTRTSGLKLMVATYDGSQNRSGLRLYINDMTTPLSGTPGGNSASVSAATYSSLSFSTVDTLIEDAHAFTGVEADLSQRTAIKEILEQYYTFS